MTRSETIEPRERVLSRLQVIKGTIELDSARFMPQFWKHYLSSLDQAILILEHISPAEYARCLEVAGKGEDDGT